MPFPSPLPMVLGGGLAAPWAYAGEIVNDVAVEVGLSAALDPFASTDPHFQQLCKFLKSLGRDLWREKAWSHLTKTHTITTLLNQSAYALPPDFGSMIQQTGWNRTKSETLQGPLSAQEWNYLLGNNGATTFTVLFRPLQSQILLYPQNSVAAGQTIAFEYISRWWVQPPSALEPTNDTPSSSYDYLWFEPALLVRGLKLAFLKAKGFDTTFAQADFDKTLALVMGEDSPMPILNLYPGTSDGLLSERNIPVTGFGG